MIVGVLTTCHTQYTWDSSICIFLFNRTTLQVFVTYLTGALYVHPLWFYKHQHDNRVRSKLFVACQRWWFQWRFWFVPSVPGYLREEEEHKPDPWHNPIERNHMGLHLENEVAHGAPTHFHRHVRKFLNQHLPQRWIGRGTDDDQMLLAWPPRSPDATPCDFFLWGYVKDQVYL